MSDVLLVDRWEGASVNLGLNHPDIGLTLELSALTLSLCNQLIIICPMSGGVPVALGDLSNSYECSVLQKIRSGVSECPQKKEQLCLKSL